jgi:hypothetical protein
MNNIGIGIFCFGEDYYLNGAKEKIEHIKEYGLSCYILTDRPDLFDVDTIPYNRSFHSYHDKLLLSKHILIKHDICILIDADIYIKDYSFLDTLKNYNFKNGVTYINTLLNHSYNKELVRDLKLLEPYKTHIKSICSESDDFETIWEYFLVFNKKGFNFKGFFDEYEKLQIVKEYSDINIPKKVKGSNEGVSISVSSFLSKTEIQKDVTLFDMIKNKLTSFNIRRL